MPALVLARRAFLCQDRQAALGTCIMIDCLSCAQHPVVSCLFAAGMTRRNGEPMSWPVRCGLGDLNRTLAWRCD